MELGDGEGGDRRDLLLLAVAAAAAAGEPRCLSRKKAGRVSQARVSKLYSRTEQYSANDQPRCGNEQSVAWRGAQKHQVQCHGRGSTDRCTAAHSVYKVLY